VPGMMGLKPEPEEQKRLLKFNVVLWTPRKSKTLEKWTRLGDSQKEKKRAVA